MMKQQAARAMKKMVVDEFDADTFDRMLTLSNPLRKMMKQQAARAMKKMYNLQLTQLLMDDRSTQLIKAMSQICPPQQLLYVMSRHLVALTGVYITQMKS
jgi:dsDNA-binding SOS-regulon protein